MKSYKRIFSESDKDYEKRFSQFIQGLQNLTNKTGIAIKVIGNVYNVKGEKIQYDDDYSSGDITFS